jgi:Domain of unknown function (DUF892)
LREILEGGGHEVIATFDADIEEGQDVMKESKGAPALDAGLLAAAQAFEHYEIARYGTLKSRAAELGLNQAMKLLETTLAGGKEDGRDPHATCGKLTCEKPSQPATLRLLDRRAPPYERGASFCHAKISP